jgi:hypothetical protein
MENDMRSGLGAPSEAELSEAIDQICLAEGVTRDKLMSVKISDGEISVRHVRSNGFGRTSTYPIAALLPRRVTRPVPFVPSAVHKWEALETAASIPKPLAVA